MNSEVDVWDHISTSVAADIYKFPFNTRLNVGSEDIFFSYITVELCGIWRSRMISWISNLTDTSTTNEKNIYIVDKDIFSASDLRSTGSSFLLRESWMSWDLASYTTTYPVWSFHFKQHHYSVYNTSQYTEGKSMWNSRTYSLIWLNQLVKNNAIIWKRLSWLNHCLTKSLCLLCGCQIVTDYETQSN